MPITPLSGSEATESNEVWGDFSGGEILIAIQHPGYLSQHLVRVAPFSADGLGTYTDSSGGRETTVQQTADNVVTLLRALYAADTTVAAMGVNQTLPDHSGTAPYPLSLATGHFGAGTAGGTSANPADAVVMQSRGSDGSRWRFVVQGASSAVYTPGAGRSLWAAVGAGAFLDFIKYLTGQTNGPVATLKTQVVTHNGVPIQAGPGANMNEILKRVRRHLKLV